MNDEEQSCICPACGTEWVDGDPQKCSTVIRDEINKLESKLAKARKALKFYAKEKSWEELHCYCGTSTAKTITEGVIHRSDIENESGGRRARKALKEIE